MHKHEQGAQGEHASGQRLKRGREARRQNRKRLALSLVLIIVYMVAEVIGGLLTNSLALLADAGHMLCDAAALGLSLFAIWITQWPPTPLRSYGYHRAEILAALANGTTLVAVALYIVIEAVRRSAATPEVEGAGMLAVATGGLAVNLIVLWTLHAGKSENLNLRGAWLHVLTDALASVAAMAAATLIWAFGWNWADPVASVLIALLVLRSAWVFLKESVGILMENAPKHLNLDRIHQAIVCIPGIRGVHDLHVWTITSGLEALSAHAVVEDARTPERLLAPIRHVLSEQFGIDHVTIQFESSDCEGCAAKA